MFFRPEAENTREKRDTIMEENARKKVMLSGIKPTGDLTLGSYLGAIKNWASGQSSSTAIISWRISTP